MSKEFKLVPASMLLDKATIGAILFHCGDGSVVDLEECSEGLLWIGNVTDDDGKQVHGLHIATAEYPEEGSTTLVEFEVPPPPALGGEPESVKDLLHAYAIGEFELEGGSPTVERMCCTSLDDWSQDHEEDSYSAGFQQAMYEHVAPLLAEIERLRYDCQVNSSVVVAQQAELKQLRARNAELEGLLRASSQLNRDIWKCGGLMAGGEQYPNALCLIDLAQRIDAALNPAEGRTDA